MTLRSFINRIRYKWLHARQQRLLAKMKAQILRLLSQNGGRITFQPDPQAVEDDCVEYPVTMSFYGKHDNPNISITDIYLDDDGEMMVDGSDSCLGNEETGFTVYPEHYAWVLDFIAIVLGYNQSRPCLGTRVCSAVKRYILAIRNVVVRRFSRNLISRTYRKVRHCRSYAQAESIVLGAGLVLSEYGTRNTDIGYASYNEDGVRDNTRRITIEYTFRQTGPDSYVADEVVHTYIG